MPQSINLMSAFQVAGYRHTIELLWDIDDRFDIKMSKEFYMVLSKS